MLAALSAILGFVAPFLPEALKYLRQKADNAHELAMMELRLKAGAQEHLWRMEEVNARADIAELRALHAPPPSFGVQILDRAQSSMHPVIWVPVFWAFAVADWLATMVRPAVTFLVVGAYCAHKAALYATLTGGRFEATWDSALTQIWTPDDFSILLFCLTFWFGQRAAKAAFGGSASHGAAGK